MRDWSPSPQEAEQSDQGDQEATEQSMVGRDGGVGVGVGVGQELLGTQG